MSSNNNSKTFIGGMLLGAAIGAVTSLLLAPRNGKATRQILKKSAEAIPELAEDISTSLQIQADRLAQTAKTSWQSTIDRLGEAIAAGIEASRQEHQTLDLKEHTINNNNSNSTDDEPLTLGAESRD